MELTNAQTEAIACADAHLENADLPTYSELLRRVADVLEGLDGVTLPGAMPVRISKLREAAKVID